MTDYIIQDATLTAIADAIRAKTETTDTMLPSEMAGLIEAISTGVELPSWVNELEFAQVTVTTSPLEFPCNMSAAPTHYLIFNNYGTASSVTGSGLGYIVLPGIFKMGTTCSVSAIMRKSSSATNGVDVQQKDDLTFTLSNGVVTCSDTQYLMHNMTYNVIMWR